MHPTAKAILYSLIGLTALVALGTLFSAVSNVSTHFAVQKQHGGSSRSAKEDADDFRRNFYEDQQVPDRIIDPRDGNAYRKEHWASVNNEGRASQPASGLPSSIPVLALPLGHSLDHQTIHYNHSSLRKRIYELVGIQEGGFGYEVKVSFLGSPPVNFDLKLITLPRGTANVGSDQPCELCECVMVGQTSTTGNKVPAPTIPSTRRKLADTEKVMFRSAPIGAAVALAQYEAERGSLNKKKDAETGLCCCSPAQLAESDSREFDNQAVQNSGPNMNQQQEGVSLSNRLVVLDKTVAVPYEKEHVVRHFETVRAAERAMGVRFLVSNDTSVSADTSGDIRGNRLFVVVSAFPKGVAEPHSAHLFSHSVQFNIKLEQLYLGGQFPLGIIIGLALVWPVCNVFLIVFLPRFMDVVKGARLAAKSKQS